MGALRFKVKEDGAFLSDDNGLAVPPWTTLRTLEAASLGFENDESGLGEKWLKQLLAPGSSLGGARPKVRVTKVLIQDQARGCGARVPNRWYVERTGGWGSTKPV